MKTRRTLQVILAVAVAFMMGSGNAWAYTLESVVPQNSSSGALRDAGLLLYENIADINAGHDGWCYVPKNDRHSSYWACTIKGKSYFQGARGPVGEVQLAEVKAGEKRVINGVVHTARKERPNYSWNPYCAYVGLQGMGSNHYSHVYKCAYWIR